MKISRKIMKFHEKTSFFLKFQDFSWNFRDFSWIFMRYAFAYLLLVRRGLAGEKNMKILRKSKPFFGWLDHELENSLIFSLLGFGSCGGKNMLSSAQFCIVVWILLGSSPISKFLFFDHSLWYIVASAKVSLAKYTCWSLASLKSL